MQTIYDAANLIDAHLVLHRLQDAGIQAQVLGGFLSGGIGELPTMGLVRVVVDDADVARALEVLEAPPDLASDDGSFESVAQ